MQFRPSTEVFLDPGPGGQLVDKVVVNLVDNIDRKPDKADDHR
jgi:hypothetical protein